MIQNCIFYFSGVCEAELLHIVNELIAEYPGLQVGFGLSVYYWTFVLMNFSEENIKISLTCIFYCFMTEKSEVPSSL